MFVARVFVGMCSVREPRSLLRELFAQFIRTDVLLACVRECVKNVHATHTPLQTPPTQTWVPRIFSVYVYPLCVGPLHFTSTQSINPEIVFTLHIIGGHLGGFFRPFFLRFTRECQYPTFVSWTHSLTLYKGELSLTQIFANSGGDIQPNDLLPRIHRVSAVSGDDDSSRSLSSSVAVCLPTVLLCF